MDKRIRIDNILKDQLQVSTIKPEDSLHDDLNADSLDVVEIIMALEEEFCIEVGDDEFYKDPCTVGRIYEYIEGATL